MQEALAPQRMTATEALNDEPIRPRELRKNPSHSGNGLMHGMLQRTLDYHSCRVRPSRTVKDPDWKAT